ncbi:MAG: SusC/RagA family TonB-linked outer membrane protein, partial [Promethearchaeota archaeon]
VQGTTRGTLTDADGEYTIEVEDPSAVLVFSFVGYATQEVMVGEQSVINISMEPEVIGLGDIVVIGYGTRTRGEITGSVNSINADRIIQTSNSDLTKALQGKVTGLIVNDRGGYPGLSDANLLIRGKATLGNNSPLIVIDGVPTANFSHISPNDIENISILKDASAAIYGARAANGVILVTTKRGKSGKASINFNCHYKLSTFTRNPEMMNSYQYVTYWNEVEERYERPLPFSEEEVQKYKDGKDPINYPSTNWYDITMKNWSPESRYNLSATGGTENIKYHVSGSILDQGGLYKANTLNYDEYQLRSNLDIQVIKNLKVGFDLYGRMENREEPGVRKGKIYYNIHLTPPTVVGFYPNGLPGPGGEAGGNPALMSGKESGFSNEKNKIFRSKISFELNMDWVTKGLKLKGYSNFDFDIYDSKTFHNTWKVYEYNKITEEYVPYDGYDFAHGNFTDLRESYNSSQNRFYNIQLNYNRNFGRHAFQGFIAYEQLEGDSKNFYAYKRDILSDKLPELFTGVEEGQQNGGSAFEEGRMNYFGSLAYNYKRKYLIDFTLRYDGSQNFPEGKRFGTFPGVSAAWVISDEEFMDGTNNWLSNLKLRVSWAKMGNDRVANFQYLTKYMFGGDIGVFRNYYIFGESPTKVNTFKNINTPNPNITWEYAAYSNVGFDAILLDNKLSANFNYFYQKRRDILITRSASIPDYTALELPAENLGKVDASGFEFELNHNNKVGDLNYSIIGNFNYNHNEIVFMDEAMDVPEFRKQEGHPMDSYVVYKTDGIFNTLEELENTKAKLNGTKVGDVKYVDVNGDGMITGDDQIRKYTSPIPEIQFGLTTAMSYKGFGLNIFFVGQTGNVEIPIMFNQEQNRPAFMFTERWTEDNPNAKYPRAADYVDFYNLKSSDLWLHNGSFIRLKELEIYYNLPSKWINFGKIQVYLRGSNLFTLDYIKWFDPEMTSQGTSYGYPPLKSIMAGVNIQL